MMKFLTTLLGGLTVLTVTGIATPPGQAMLGMRQPQTVAPVSVIADPGPASVPAPVAAPVQPVQPVTAVPAAPAVAAPQPAVTAPRPVAQTPAAAPRPVAISQPAPVARPAAPAAPAGAVPAAGANPMGGAGAITNILLNLPQVLQGGQVGPADRPGVGNSPGWVPPGQRGRDDKWRRKHGAGDNDAGDFEH